MTTRADFTEAEWELLVHGPANAGMCLVTASSGGSFRETFAMAHAYAETRAQHGASELLDDLVSTRPKAEKSRSAAELRSTTLDHLRQAMALLRAKATDEEAADYRRFVLAVADRVARAHDEDNAPISPAEQQAIDEITAALDDTSA